MSTESTELQKQPAGSDLALQDEQMAKFANLMTTGDFSKMTKPEKDRFCISLAQSLGLMPWPPPFIFIPGQNGKELLYATKSCADQLRKIHKINIEITYQGPLQIGEQINQDIYCVRAKATMPDGRCDEDAGTISLKGKAGEDLANAILRCVTKAKRRVTYTITGLSLPDETEARSFSQDRGSQVEGPREMQPRVQDAVRIEEVR